MSGVSHAGIYCELSPPAAFYLEEGPILWRENCTVQNMF